MTKTESFAMRIPCGVYEHYKGKRYFVVGLGREHRTNEVVVIYCRLYSRDGLPLSVRPAVDFLADVEWRGRTVTRFTYVGLRESDGSDGAEDDPTAGVEN